MANERIDELNEKLKELKKLIDKCFEVDAARDLTSISRVESFSTTSLKPPVETDVKISPIDLSSLNSSPIKPLPNIEAD